MGLGLLQATSSISTWAMYFHCIQFTEFSLFIFDFSRGVSIDGVQKLQ